MFDRGGQGWACGCGLLSGCTEGNTSCVAEETRTSPATPQEEKRQFCLPVIPEGDRWEPCMTCCSCEEEQVTLDLVGFRLFML